MLEKGKYISLESRFRRLLDNKLEERDEMWHSIEKGPYVRQMIPNPDSTTEQILKLLSKITKRNKKQYITDVRVMNYLLQAIPNDIYNSVDACKNAKDMWERIKRLMYGSHITSHVRHSRLMDEFDKFTAKEGESLESVYERLETLVNIMDRNNVYHIPVSINTKFLNCLQPGWSKYVTMKATKNHDPLSFLAHSNASSLQSHANSSYLPQPYYVTHPSSVVDYKDEYQGELQGDSQEDKLITTMMLLARAITQKFTIPTNNCLYTLSNTRNQAVIQDGRVDIQTKNACYGGNGYQNLERLKKAIVAQPKMYHGEMLHSIDLNIDSPYSEETLEDSKESRLKMRNKMVQLNYGKLNAFYETFVPQQEPSVEQPYFSIPSIYNNCSETKEITSDLQISKIPKESKLLKMFEKIGIAINDLRKQIDVTLLEDRQRRWKSDNQNSLREYHKTDVILMSESLSTNLKEL
nr:hypothetical protein [Tanacetum cinerariifolium]